MTETAEPIEDRLADFTRDKRILLLSLMAVVVGVLSAVVAKALVWLIAVFTNLTFYQRFSSDFVSPGVGYDTIHALLKGELVGAVVIGLLIGKAVVWSISLGSGTSGGVLAPLLIIGGALGAIEGRFIPIGDPGLWALISMAAMMGGTMRSPLTSMIFTLELTHDLNLL